MTDLARELVSQMRQQAGREVSKNAPMPEFGIVTKDSPLQIKPGFTGRTSAGTAKGSYTLGAKDIVCNTDDSLEAGDVVVLLPIKGGYYYAQKVRAGTQAPRNTTAGGADAPAGDPSADPVTGDAVAPVASDLDAADRIVEVARAFKGMTGAGNPSSFYQGTSATSVAQWCRDLNYGGLVAWCAVYVSKVYELASVEIGGIRSGYVGDMNKGPTVITSPVRGCLVCRGDDHVNIYISGPKQNALCIGGNQGGGSSSETRAVTERTENISGSNYRYIQPPGLQAAGRATEAPDSSGTDS